MITTVTLGPVEVQLRPPSSYSILTEVSVLAGTNYVRACGMALAVCWRSTHPPKTKMSDCGYSPAEFGRRVVDELVGRRIPIQDILRGGQAALKLIQSSMATEEEVKEQAGFSDGADPSEPPA